MSRRSGYGVVVVIGGGAGLRRWSGGPRTAGWVATPALLLAFASGTAAVGEAARPALGVVKMADLGGESS